MKTITEHKSELILSSMMISQLFTIFFPGILPEELSNVILLILLIGFILCKLEHIDYKIKRKFN